MTEEESIGRRLREARCARKLTQVQVGTQLGIVRSGVSGIEAGTRKLGVLELADLAHLYGRPVAWFMSGEAEEFDNPTRALRHALDALAPSELETVRRIAECLRTENPGEEVLL